MGAFNSNYEQVTYYKLQSGKRDEKPFFGKKGNKESGYKVTDTFDTFEGHLYNIELGSYEFEGKMKDTIKLSFEDTIGKSVIEGSFNTGIMRSILNTIAGGDLNKPFMLKLYLNKEGYPSVYIEQSGTRASWKYEPVNIPKVETIKLKNGNEIKDDSDVAAWFKKLVNEEIKPMLKSIQQPVNKSLPDIPDTPAVETRKSMVSGGSGMTQEQNDDLPF